MVRADDLVMLLEVARAGTLKAAADALGVNHTTVARRVRQLEKELGVPVLSSTTQGTYLTEVGQSLIPAAELVEQALHRATALTPSRTDQDLSGLVRVSAPEAFSAWFVAPAVAWLHAQHPGLLVELTTATRPLLQGSGADVEIGLSLSSARRADLIPISDYDFGLYATVDYLERRGVPGSAAELEGHSIVYYIQAQLRVEDLMILPDKRVHISSNSVLSQVEAVRADAGIGLLPRFVAARYPDLVPVLPDEVRPQATFVAALAPAHIRRSPTLYVLDAIRREVRRRKHELLPQ